jgi:hypothetical protein
MSSIRRVDVIAARAAGTATLMREPDPCRDANRADARWRVIGPDLQKIFAVPTVLRA